MDSSGKVITYYRINGRVNFLVENFMNVEPMFSSLNEDWETPKWLFDAYDKIFHFNLDVCASDENALCKKYFTKEQDGLNQKWVGNCWMNPPYGRTIKYWLKKAYESSLNGATVVCLVPARTDTAWWHDYCMNGEIIFLRGRLKFSNYPNNAPFPNAIVIFRAIKKPTRYKLQVMYG